MQKVLFKPLIIENPQTKIVKEMLAQATADRLEKLETYQNEEELLALLRAGKIRLSFSALKAFSTSPKSFIAYKLRRLREKEGKETPTPSQILGRLVHCLALEGEAAFNDRYLVKTSARPSGKEEAFLKGFEVAEGSFRKRAALAFSVNYKHNYKKAETIEKNAVKKLFSLRASLRYLRNKKGREEVNGADYELARFMVESLLKNPFAAELLSRAPRREVKKRFNFEGFEFLSVLDAENEEGKPELILDLKTVTSADFRSVSREIIKNSSFAQLALYRLAAQKPGAEAFILAVDKKGEVCAVKIEEDLLAAGEARLKVWLRDFRKCLIKEEFNRSSDFYTEKGYFSLTAPNWLVNE